MKKRTAVVAFSLAFFAVLATAPRHSSGADSSGDPALANQNSVGSNGQTMQGNQAYQQGYNQAYNQAYAQKTQELDNQNSNSKGGCCG